MILLKKFVVSYNEWGIQVEAETVEQAKTEAYISFQKFYLVPVCKDKFMKGIYMVREV